MGHRRVKAQRPSGDSYDDTDWVFPFEHYLAADLRLAEMVRAVRAGRIVNLPYCGSSGLAIRRHPVSGRYLTAVSRL